MRFFRDRGKIKRGCYIFRSMIVMILPLREKKSSKMSIRRAFSSEIVIQGKEFYVSKRGREDLKQDEWIFQIGHHLR